LHIQVIDDRNEQVIMGHTIHSPSESNCTANDTPCITFCLHNSTLFGIARRPKMIKNFENIYNPIIISKTPSFDFINNYSMKLAC